MIDSYDEELYDSIPCGLLSTDADDVVLRVNSTLLRWTGYTREQVVGHPFHHLLHMGSQAFYGTRFQTDLWQDAEAREVVLSLRRADGTAMPILVNAELREPEGRPPRVNMAVFDSTGRHDYERQMLAARRLAESSEASLRVLQDASSLFLAAHTEEELGLAVSASAREAFAASQVAVVAYDPDGASYHIVIGGHLRPLFDAVRSSRATTRPLHSDEVLFIANLDEAFARSEEVGTLFRENRIEAFAAIPISDGEVVLGAFVCMFGRARENDAAAVALQLALARQAGLVLARIRLQVQLEKLALHDTLTGLANRTLLDERLTHTRAIAERSSRPMSLVFVDLDGFKRINDDLGHRVGDTVLQAVSARMNGAVRDVDLVGRFGGDEFIVICEDSDADAARLVADRIAASVREPLSFLPDGYGVTASIGVAVYDPPVSGFQTNDTLVRLADDAMYESKRAGADGVFVRVV